MFRRGLPRPRPTGTYTDWRWPPPPDGYTRFDWTLVTETDPSPDGYFWCPGAGEGSVTAAAGRPDTGTVGNTRRGVGGLRDVITTIADALDAFHGEGVDGEYEPYDERAHRWVARYPPN